MQQALERYEFPHRQIAACDGRIETQLQTFAEQGFPNLVADAWMTLLGPKGMDPALIKRVFDATVVTLGSAATKLAIEKQGGVVALGTPEEARVAIARDLAKYTALVKKIGLVAE